MKWKWVENWDEDPRMMSEPVWISEWFKLRCARTAGVVTETADPLRDWNGNTKAWANKRSGRNHFRSDDCG